MVRKTRKNLALATAEPILAGVSTTARGNNCKVIDLTLEDNDLMNGGRTVADQQQLIPGAELMVIDGMADNSTGVDAPSSVFARSVSSNAEPADRMDVQQISIDQSARLDRDFTCLGDTADSRTRRSLADLGPESRADADMTNSRTGHSLTNAVLAVAPVRQAEIGIRMGHSFSNHLSPKAPVLFSAGKMTNFADSQANKTPVLGPGSRIYHYQRPSLIYL
ncbi:hypothetical protein BDZ88DRAFT_447850 [Geranomyces variabilis]|nr:hypothetical protein BDZ88DRAFT_447850 [Geranomyces variabilis]KAJ3143024.1 hypothetical protein HDU90_002898 [Geranomyces variabilis]